jgi:hypothetical protein
MGWWKQDEDGNSFCLDSDMIWGDTPADIMDDAIEKIVAAFLAEGGRKPTAAELKAGLLFSLGAYEEDSGAPSPMPVVSDVIREAPDAEAP